MSRVIELQHVTKMFGKSRGVLDITFSVDEGGIVGFLGPNGAGKTTTINMLMGYTRPTEGELKLFGKNIRETGLDARKDIGFLASDMALDGNLTGWQQLEYFGSIRKRFDANYIYELAKRLDSDLTRKTKTLSRGNRQKVGLISALMHKPRLLLLDEPTSGLDPLIQAEFNKIILEHKAAGNTTFISSHVLSEVEELCDRMIFIREGKIIADKSLQELSEAGPKQVKIRHNHPESAEKKLKKLAAVTNVQLAKNHLTFEFRGDIQSLLKTLGTLDIQDVTISDTNLEQSFMAYYGGEE